MDGGKAELNRIEYAVGKKTEQERVCMGKS